MFECIDRGIKKKLKSEVACSCRTIFSDEFPLPMPAKSRSNAIGLPHKSDSNFAAALPLLHQGGASPSPPLLLSTLPNTYDSAPFARMRFVS